MESLYYTNEWGEIIKKKTKIGESTRGFYSGLCEQVLKYTHKKLLTV